MRIASRSPDVVGDATGLLLFLLCSSLSDESRGEVRGEARGEVRGEARGDFCSSTGTPASSAVIHSFYRLLVTRQLSNEGTWRTVVCGASFLLIRICRLGSVGIVR